jgi:hypothetical protein
LSRGRRYGNFARIDQRELARNFGNCTADGARRREISRRRSAGPPPAREAKQQALLASDAGADPEAQPFQPPDFAHQGRALRGRRALGQASGSEQTKRRQSHASDCDR